MLEFWLEFARGPLFRFSFALLVLGLIRILILTGWALGKTYVRAGDKNIPFKAVLRDTLHWLIPFRIGLRNRPVFSIISIIFHIGLILVPIFLFAHIRLWYENAGLWWPALPRLVADVLTVTTIVAAILLFAARVGSSSSRHISGGQEFMWPLLLAVPFVSGFLCAHPSLNPISYQVMMLVHLLSGNLILMLIPFTKIAHCILVPFSQLVSEMGWRFPKHSARNVEITLGKQGQPL